jgi:hypothetical protein
MFSYDSKTSINNKMLSQLKEFTKSNLRNRTNTYANINPNPNKNDDFLVIPFISFFSFLAGYYFGKYYK